MGSVMRRQLVGTTSVRIEEEEKEEFEDEDEEEDEDEIGHVKQQRSLTMTIHLPVRQ